MIWEGIFMKSFGLRLKHLRIEKGLTQDELAKKLGVAKSTISLYETNAREPNFNMLTRIADFFNVTVDGLLGRGSLFPLGEREKEFMEYYKSLPEKEKREVESFTAYLNARKKTDQQAASCEVSPF